MRSHVTELAILARLGLREDLAVKVVNTLCKSYRAVILCGDGTPDPSLIKCNNVLIVAGDEDDIIITKRARELNSLLNGRKVSVGGIGLGGVSGLQPHQDIRLLYPQHSIDVLISHYPPYGVLDRVEFEGKEFHVGIIELNQLIRKVNPAVVLFTHVELEGIARLKEGYRQYTLFVGFRGGLNRYVRLVFEDSKVREVGFTNLNLPSH